MEPHDFRQRLVIATGAAGVDPATLSRHLPILHSCVPDDDPILFARVDRPDDRCTYLLLLTGRRLVVTGESRVLHRRRLHLNADPRHLLDVIWTAEPTLGGVALSATAIDGVREHFWIRTPEPDTAVAALARVFPPAVVPGLKPALIPTLAPALTPGLALRPAPPRAPQFVASYA